MCDVALDPYTSHGHDGIIIGKKLIMMKQLKILIKTIITTGENGL